MKDTVNERSQNHGMVWDPARHGLKRWTSWNAISRMLGLPRACMAHHQHPSASANQINQRNRMGPIDFKLIWNEHEQYTLEMGDFVILCPLRVVMSVYN